MSRCARGSNTLEPLLGLLSPLLQMFFRAARAYQVHAAPADESRP